MVADAAGGHLTLIATLAPGGYALVFGSGLLGLAAMALWRVGQSPLPGERRPRGGNAEAAGPRTIFRLMAVGTLALVALYFGGGYHTFNPSDHAHRARSVIAPEMTWQQVLDRAGAPVRYGRTPASYRRPGGGADSLDATRLWVFNRQRLEADIAGEAMKGGFAFYYRFTTEDAFWVMFDPSGRVSQVIDEQPSGWGPRVERRLRIT